MKIVKLLFTLLILTAPAFAQSGGGSRGTPFVTGNGTSDRAIDVGTGGSMKLVALGFLPQQSKTITEVSIYSIAAGTIGASDAKLGIYSDSAGAPNALLGSAVSFDASTTGVKRVTFSQAVTAGTQYWFVTWNPNATGGDYHTIRVMPEGAIGLDMGAYGTADVGRLGASVRESGNNGTSWSNFERTASAPYRVKFSDNTYLGYPYTDSDYSTNPIATGDRVYSALESGNKFTVSGDADLNFNCVAFNVGTAAGTPTGNIRYRLYDSSSTTPIATSNVSAAPRTARSWLPLCFSTTQTLTAGSTYRLSVGESTQSDTSSDAYGPFRFDWDSDSNSLALKPFNGTLSKTVLNGTWSDTTSSFYAMSILPVPGDEYTCAGGGGGGTCDVISWNGTPVANLYDGTISAESTTDLTLGGSRVSADDQFNDGFAIVVYDVNGLVQAKSCIVDTVNTGDHVITIKDISALIAPGDTYIIKPESACASNLAYINGLSTATNLATLYLKQLYVENSSGSAIVANSTGSNGSGAFISGNGSAPGLRAVGGISAAGAQFEGLTTGGSGTGPGLVVKGGATSGPAIQATSTTGDVITATAAAGNGNALVLAGQGSGTGFKTTGGATGAGLTAVGGSTSGAGILTSVTSGNKIDGNLSGTIGGLTAAGLATLFNTNSGTTYASAVAGSPVKEIATNAAGGGGGGTCDVTSWNGTPVLTPDVAGVPKVTIVDGTGAGQIDTASGKVSLVSTQTFNNTGTWTGNLTGSVGSVTGNVNGSVGSVAGNVAGNVTGSVGSVAAGGITGTSLAQSALARFFNTDSGSTYGLSVNGSIVKEIADHSAGGGGGGGSGTIEAGGITPDSFGVGVVGHVEIARAFGKNTLTLSKDQAALIDDKALNGNSTILIVDASKGRYQNQCICNVEKNSGIVTLCSPWTVPLSGTVKYSIMPQAHCYQ